jgi:citrate lyase subunit beta/citryl-CoA lyase
VGAVRINKLDEDGLDDLRGVMPGAPAAVFLPHAETATQMQLLALEITVLERELGLAEGQTEIVPTLESARGVVAAPSILSATPRISACLLAAGDLGADLDVVNGPDAVELQHVRARFLVDCIAAGCVPIDSPCNYRRPGVIEAELAWARRIGLKAKCTVFPDQVAAIHAAFTPSARQATDAAALVTAFEAARDGQPADGPRVEIPDANTARRLLARHASFAAWARTSGSTGPA